MTSATTSFDEPVLQGDDDDGPVANWTLRLLGPGGVNATIHDLLALVEAVLRPSDDRLRDAVSLALEPRAEGPGCPVGLGWLLDPAGIAACGGATAGFSAYVAAHRRDRRAVAIAINRSTSDTHQAVALAAARGRDPRTVVPQPFEGDPGPWTEQALELFRALVALDFERARELMTPETAAALTVERLRSGWIAVLRERGTLGEPGIGSLTRAPGGVQVAVVAPGSEASLTVCVWLDGDRRVAGVALR